MSGLYNLIGALQNIVLLGSPYNFFSSVLQTNAQAHRILAMKSVIHPQIDQLLQDIISYFTKFADHVHTS